MNYILFLLLLFFNVLYGGGFSSQTVVLTKNGYVEISEIKPGDYVLTCDNNNELIEEKVIVTYRHKVNRYVRIIINDEIVETTLDHCFRLFEDKTWQKAEQLTCNDGLLQNSLLHAVIQSVEIINESKEFFDLSLKKHNNFYISHQNINVHNFLCGLVLAFTFESTLASFAFESVTALIALAGVCVGIAMDYCGRKQIIAGDPNNPAVIYQEQGFGSNKTAEQLAEEERQEWQQKAALYYQEHAFHHIENSEVQNHETKQTSEIVTSEIKNKINDEGLIESTYQNILVENNTITVSSENGSVSMDVENICNAISESIDNPENYVIIRDSDHNNFVYKKCSDLNVHECAYNFAQTISLFEPTKNAFIDGMHAVCKGAAYGLINSIKEMATHSVETMTNAIAGKYLFVCQLGNIVYNSAKIGVTALVDPEKGLKEWKEYTVPVVSLMHHIQAATTTELLEQGAAFIVGFVVQNKVLGKLNNVYNSATNKVLVCANGSRLIAENNCFENDRFQQSKKFTPPKSGYQKNSNNKITECEKIKFPHGKYEDAGYHSKVGNVVKSARPTDGQKALDTSLLVEGVKEPRVSILKGEFVVLYKTQEGLYHGHVRAWKELTKDMQKALKNEKFVNHNGKILKEDM